MFHNVAEFLQFLSSVGRVSFCAIKCDAVIVVLLITNYKEILNRPTMFYTRRYVACGAAI